MKSLTCHFVFGVASWVFATAPLLADSTSKFVLPGGIVVTITEAPFDKSKARIDGCSVHTNQCSINGLPPFGIDLEIPTTYVKKITVSIGGRVYRLDATNMYNAWGYRSPGGNFSGECADRMNCTFYATGSDGAGGFAAMWEIRDGRPFRTLLTNDEEIFWIIDKRIHPERQTPM